jgi:hypothetical protein
MELELEPAVERDPQGFFRFTRRVRHPGPTHEISHFKAALKRGANNYPGRVWVSIQRGTHLSPYDPSC